MNRQHHFRVKLCLPFTFFIVKLTTNKLPLINRLSTIHSLINCSPISANNTAFSFIKDVEALNGRKVIIMNCASAPCQKPASPKRPPPPRQQQNVPSVFRADDYFASQAKQWHNGGGAAADSPVSTSESRRGESGKTWRLKTACRPLRKDPPRPQRSNNSLYERVAGNRAHEDLFWFFSPVFFFAHCHFPDSSRSTEL